jgi:hypothetical protein
MARAVGGFARKPKLEGMSWRKILSQHDMRSAEAYPHGYGEVRRVALMARRSRQIALSNLGFRVYEIQPDSAIVSAFLDNRSLAGIGVLWSI